MFGLMFGLGNIVCALAVCGLPIRLFNPVSTKQRTRTDMFKVLGAMFPIGFLMVPVGQYHRTPQL